MNKKQIILASGSPRRKELLEQMGLHFETVPSDFEEVLNPDKPTSDVAVELGLGKARKVAEQYPDALVIGGDTIVTMGGQQLGKPKDVNEAREWLKAHADQDVLVTSSVVLVCKNANVELAQVDESLVHFNPLNEAAIEQYLATGDWMDKAGGWGIQSGAAPLVEFVQGRYDTVLGLPTHLLAGQLYSQGVKVKPLDLVPPVKHDY
jgi:septum formation protein